MLDFGKISRVQSHRMEAYTILMGLVGLLGFSHVLGYWPYGSEATAKQTATVSEQKNGGIVQSHPIDDRRRMNYEEVAWRIVFLFGVLGTGLLFYLGKRADSAKQPPVEAMIEIDNKPEPQIAVTLMEAVIGTFEHAGQEYIAILIRAHVLNRREPAVKIGEVYLELYSDDYRSGWGKEEIPEGLTFTRLTGNVTEEPVLIDPTFARGLTTIPLAPLRTREGWLIYTARGARHECYFSRTYLLSVTDDSGQVYRCERTPGGWMNPVLIHWPPLSGTRFNRL